MTNKKTIQDIDVEGKTVLVRAEFNVTFHPGTTSISDDSRIRATLPTIRYLLDHKAKIVLCSHLGRPKGKMVPELRMSPISERLSTILGQPVIQANDCIGADVQVEVEAMTVGDILMLENLRFNPGEEANHPVFARELASLADIYVNDAFGAAHRAHASIEGITHHLPAVSGLLMARELEMLQGVLESPKQPLVAIIGGAKVSDKLLVLENLIDKVRTLIVGGGMAATFLKSQGLGVGDSLIEEDLIERAGEIMRGASEAGVELLLPTDVVVADAFTEEATSKVVEVSQIQHGWRIMDIGPETSVQYAKAVSEAGTVVWNGTMGVFEWDAFTSGTKQLAEALAGLNDTTTVIGGGSTAEAIVILGLGGKMTHVSTGGGASLEFFEGKELPGVVSLLDSE